MAYVRLPAYVYTVLMGPYVHRDLTIKWAVEAGFSPEEAELVGRANLDLDKKRLAKPWVHFRLFGAGLIGAILAWRARRRRDLRLLGYALHAAQDAASHGWIFPFQHNPSLDEWSKADTETQDRIKKSSQAILKRYLL